jgi:hypothetical protein
MATDTLSLAGIVFDDFSAPSRLPFGGRQAMVIHKLPGGSRAIDTLGPDEDDIAFEAQFFGNDAWAKVQALEGVRAAGQVVPLIFNGQTRLVILSAFLPKDRRFPVWFEYALVCTVYQNPGLGILGAVAQGVDSMLQADLSLAIGLL